MLSIGPIYRSLLRKPVGAVLIMLQIALTLAITCNALFIIDQRLKKIGQDTGIADEEIIFIRSVLVGNDVNYENQRIKDLDAVKNLPGVKFAAYTNSIPLGTSNSTTTVCKSLDSNEDNCVENMSLYLGESTLAETFGVNIIEGRGFLEDEIVEGTSFGSFSSDVIILSKAVADSAFPNGDAVGKTIYLASKDHKIVGIVDAMLRPASGIAMGDPGFSALMPIKFDPQNAGLLLRVEASMLEAMKETIKQTLLAEDKRRIFAEVSTMEDRRKIVYGNDRAMMILLFSTVIFLVIVTALGITGLVSFNVASRQKQIGTRRALGARKSDVLNYFLVENGLIASVGVGIGILFAYLLNQYLIRAYDQGLLGVGFVLIGFIMVAVISQLATLFPALKATKISPATATRTL